jgi:hypothetical protein
MLLEVLMKRNLFRLVISGAVYLIFSIIRINAEYIEGIDTTDSNGFGLDSSFGISPRTDILSGNDIISFSSNRGWTLGYLDCSFDDLKIVPDTIRENGDNAVDKYFTFIIRNKKDSTYAKVKLIKKIGDMRYIFKYGKNTIPNDRMLMPSDYNRSIRYKPNNLYNWADFMGAFPNRFQWDTLYWEPPIQNNNHLLGYILCASKSKWETGIDTAKPIDSTQWDSVAFYSDSIKKAALSLGVNGSYINLVALYAEGKSEFLDGWTLLNVVPVSVSMQKFVFTPMQKTMSIAAIPGGFFITVPYLPSSEPFSISIFNPNGSLHSRISGIKGARAFLGNNFAGGLYLLRAEFPDRSVLTQPFAITR